MECYTPIEGVAMGAKMYAEATLCPGRNVVEQGTACTVVPGLSCPRSWCRALKWKAQSPNTEHKLYELLCAAAEQLRGGKRAPFFVECTVIEANQVRCWELIVNTASITDFKAALWY